MLPLCCYGILADIDTHPALDLFSSPVCGRVRVETKREHRWGAAGSSAEQGVEALWEGEEVPGSILLPWSSLPV